MRICSLDLEMNQPSNNIIQVGYVIVDTESEEVVLSRSIHTALPEDEELSSDITKLTGIRPEDLQFAGSVREAYDQLVEDMKLTQCLRHLFTWGNGDVRLLKQQSSPHYAHYVYDQFFDVKKIYQAWAIANGKSVRSGLAKSMLRLGLTFEGKKHQAVDDAFNTAVVYLRLQEKLRDN